MPLKSCTHCLAGKQHRASFQHGHAQRKPNVLDVVYYDVCGPMTTSTLGGARYFVTFIADHSRKVWAYALRIKNQVYEVFKQFHASVERETGRSFKCIAPITGEYMGVFRNYCRSNGIRHERSVPKTPQHNGIAERMNRTIVERIRTMLSHAKLPKSFWGEALMIAVDLINLSFSTFE
ncbi:transposable element gene [Prunus dulcis]|uniref:Transposable element protein n=1 Tax=Prunus dulcis TaxID=3755 RepID=A0A4Y1RDY2_PRUDU|nr:transposable element gene [Prunus dulcis]